jgi:hypothetical protein
MGQAAGTSPSPPVPPTPTAEQSRAVGVEAELRARASSDCRRTTTPVLMRSVSTRQGGVIRLSVVDELEGFAEITILGYMKADAPPQPPSKEDAKRLAAFLHLEVPEP